MRVGKIGKENAKANRKLKFMFDNRYIHFCEARLLGCQVGIGLTFAHRHKRIWYRNKMHKLSEYKQVVLACLNCHMQMEQSPMLTEEIFLKARGRE